MKRTAGMLLAFLVACGGQESLGPSDEPAVGPSNTGQEADTLDELRVEAELPDAFLSSETPIQLRAIGVFRSGREQDLTEVASWSIDSSERFGVDAGRITVSGHRGGSATAYAEHEGVSGSLLVTAECKYPEAGNGLAPKETVPNYYWEEGRTENGSSVSVSMEDLYCNETFSDRKVAWFFIGAGWCTGCPPTAQNIIDTQLDWLLASGGLMFWLESETERDRELASIDYAERTMNRYLGSAPGVRLGGADTRHNTLNAPGAFRDYIRNYIASWPAALAIRLSDMTIIADDARFGTYPIPYAQVVRYPEEDWFSSKYRNYEQWPWLSTCGADEEEAENQANNGAPVTLALGTKEAGLCIDDIDAHWIDYAGSWKLTLRYDFSRANLVALPFLTITDGIADVMRDGAGNPIIHRGGGGGVIIRGQGPLGMLISSFDRSGAPYELTLERD